MASTIYTDCAHCGARFGQPYDPGRPRQFCSNACRQAAYRARKRRQGQEQQRQEQRRQRQREDRKANEDAWRRARDRYQRARARSQQPPPHAGTSRPGTWCGPCGGMRGPHTFHHDDAAHQRARRRYEGLHAEAASTSFPEEAAAYRMKAEQLRAKYGL
jgi:hypothetical protein